MEWRGWGVCVGYQFGEMTKLEPDRVTVLNATEQPPKSGSGGEFVS